MDFEVSVSYTTDVPESIPGDFVSRMRDAGIDVETEERESAPYAGAEWLLLPTAIVVFLSKKYFGTMLQEMAKDHYSIIKNQLKKLISRAAGPNREFQFKYAASSPEKTSQDQAPALSVYSEMKDGRPIKFVVENLSTEEEVSKCVDSLLNIMNTHYISGKRLQNQIDKVSRRQDQEAVMRFNRDEEEWYLAYPSQ